MFSWGKGSDCPLEHTSPPLLILTKAFLLLFNLRLLFSPHLADFLSMYLLLHFYMRRHTYTQNPVTINDIYTHTHTLPRAKTQQVDAIRSSVTAVGFVSRAERRLAKCTDSLSLLLIWQSALQWHNITVLVQKCFTNEIVFPTYLSKRCIQITSEHECTTLQFPNDKSIRDRFINNLS